MGGKKINPCNSKKKNWALETDSNELNLIFCIFVVWGSFSPTYKDAKRWDLLEGARDSLSIVWCGGASKANACGRIVAEEGPPREPANYFPPSFPTQRRGKRGVGWSTIFRESTKINFH